MENKYILSIKTVGQDNINLELQKRNSSDIFSDFDIDVSNYTVYNDKYYNITLFDNNGNELYGYEIFINGERLVQNCGYIFNECWGVIKIEIEIGIETYVTNNLIIMISKDSVSQSIINMIDYIYDNCDEYLYEEHKYSRISSGFKSDKNISIDSKLSLIKETYDTFLICYNYIKNSAKTKLIDVERIADFEGLRSISPNTIRYILTHPEELQAVNYNSGISYNKQYYQPRKTIVQSVSYSYDIYENRILIGFLKTVLMELDSMNDSLLKKIDKFPKEHNGYIASIYYIYTKNSRLINQKIEGIKEFKHKFQQIYYEYKSMLGIDADLVVFKPQYTSIFRQVMPYRLIFNVINKWFSCGNYDIVKSDLLLSFISTSKIYEYFCLIKINKAIHEIGYTMIDSFSYKYNENKYYSNTKYNNTFKYTNGKTLITVYFQPIISGDLKRKTNDIQLYRTTSISAIKNDDDTQAGKKSQKIDWYTPDYLIKIELESETRYVVMDAKHSRINSVLRYQLPNLVYKYLFSLNVINENNKLCGMCILCGKEENNKLQNIHDIAEKARIQINPRTFIMGLSGNEAYDNSDLEDIIKKYIK